jgi:hypothetical protein
MNENSRLYAETETRISGLLEEVGPSFAESERGEVVRFLKAGEYGLALETFASILVEEAKPIDANVLHHIDEAAVAMHLRDERFMYDLHNFYDHQHRVAM